MSLVRMSRMLETLFKLATDLLLEAEQVEASRRGVTTLLPISVCHIAWREENCNAQIA